MEKANFQIIETKSRSERGDLLNFFIENIKDKNGDLYTSKRMAIKLSHLKLPDLYYFVSVCKDVQRRRGDEAMGKFFNWSLKVQK